MSPSCISEVFATMALRFVFAGFAAVSTLDLNLDLHLEHLKIPARNSGMSPVDLCFAGATVQHLMAAATSVSQFGQLTNK